MKNLNFKKFCLVIVSLTFIFFDAYATDIPGGNVSGTWTLSNSPYHINGEIIIPNDSTLTIESGVEVVFMGHYKFNVQGRLLAIGTLQDTITFTAQDTKTGWHGIRFNNTAGTNDSSKIIYCKFQYGKANTGNGLDRSGGAILISRFDKVLVSNCLFDSNVNNGDLYSTGGAAIFIEYASPVITNSTFTNNEGITGAIGCLYDSKAIISNNVFTNNKCRWGGGVGCGVSSNNRPVISGNYISDNSAEDGGGVYLVWTTNALVINNVIIRNHATGEGGGINCEDTGSQQLIIANNTVAYNSAPIGGGIETDDNSDPIIINTIFYGNSANVGNQICVSMDISDPCFINCNIEGGKDQFGGSGAGLNYNGTYKDNIDSNPLFVDVANDDYHLSYASPCIGAGADSVEINGARYYASSADFEGNPRPNPIGSAPDIGAFENDLSTPTTDIAGGDVSGTWTLANSPYHINGEITIPNGETLIIEPGVEVIFTGHYKFNVQGRLLAIGTEKDTIIFTAQDKQTGWSGLKFPSTPSSNDTSKIVYCVVKNTQAKLSSMNVGGAISVTAFNKLIISNCLITKNKTNGDLQTGGAGIGIMSCSPVIENNTISYNTAEGGHGGGIFVGGNSNPVINNNVISCNRATGGAGFASYQCNPVLINNTITENVADLTSSVPAHGGGIDCIGTSPIFLNTILYGNKSGVGSQVHLASPSEPTFSFCDIEGGTAAFARNHANGGSYNGIYQSNIDKAPLFVNSTSNDYRLSDASPCIGAGSDSIQINTNWYCAPTYDFEGNPRPNPKGLKPDIGAFENKLGTPLTNMREDEITSPSLAGNLLGDPATRKMMVYLPPSYDQGGNFPVVYLLHALPVGETAYLIEENWLDWVGVLWSAGPDFPENGFEGMLDDLIAKGKMKEMIIVMPDACCKYMLSWYTNSVLNGNYEDYIVNDLVSYIDSHYRTIPNRDNRAIVGFCMGGYGAIKLAMKHKDVFGIAACHSGPLYFEGLKAFILAAIAENPDGMIGPHPERTVTNLIYSGSAAFSPNLNNPPFFVDLPFEYPSGAIIDSVWNKWLEHDPFTMLGTYGSNLALLNGVYVDCGDQDELGFNHHAEAFHQALTAAGIKHEYEIFAGGTHCNKLYSRLANSLSFISDEITGVKQRENAEVPSTFSLSQNYPNPFNPITNIGFRIANFGFVSLKVFDLLGREVATLVNEEKPAGNYEVEWNARGLSSGVYFYKLKAGSYVATKKMILLK